MLARIRRSVEEDDEGFTLIELLVVIIIIGILAAIAIPVFLSQREKGYDAAVRSDLRNASTAEETYLTDHGTYTSTLSDLTAEGFTPSPPGDYDSDDNAVDIVPLTDATDSDDGPNSTGYCLSATSSSGNTFYYNSLDGGMTTDPCPFTSITGPIGIVGGPIGVGRPIGRVPTVN